MFRLKAGLLVLALVHLIPVFSKTWKDMTGVYEPLVEPSLMSRAPVTLQAWARAEILFYGKLKTEAISAHGEYESIQGFISEYLRDFERSNSNLEGFPNGTLEEKVSAVTSNPIATVFMLRRSVKILKKLKKRLKKPNPNYALPPKWPRSEDLKDAIWGLLRLVHMYNLDLKALAAGEFQGIKTGARLTSRDLYDIGTFDMKSTEYIVTTIQLLEFAYQRSKVDREIEPGVVKEALYERIILHDQEMRSTEAHEHFFGYLLREAIPRWGPFLYFVGQSVNEYYLSAFKGIPTPAVNLINFQVLCRQRSLLTPDQEKHLFCWYEQRKDPYFLINPLKAELLVRSPDLFQFYDILGKEKIETLKRVATNSFEDSRLSLRDEEDEDGSYASHRTSVTAHNVEDNSDPALRNLSKTVELMTGLKVADHSASEPLQIAAYSFVGYFDLHHDLVSRRKGTGEAEGIPRDGRIGTFTYYLEEPKLGGYTAFPYLNVAARPVKGSAVFWYNMYRDGQEDEYLTHGACPVILGEKWVGNKWIHHYDQFLKSKSSGRGEVERFYLFPPEYLTSIKNTHG